jgi:hypothetical protein
MIPIAVSNWRILPENEIYLARWNDIAAMILHQME